MSTRKHLWPAAAFLFAAAVVLRGPGDSEWDAAGRYDIGAHVSDLSAALSTLGSRPVVVVGHSMGAEIAIHLASTSSRRLLGLVLVDFGPGPMSSASQNLLPRNHRRRTEMPG